jgi:hypothetical protein
MPNYQFIESKVVQPHSVQLPNEKKQGETISTVLFCPFEQAIELLTLFIVDPASQMFASCLIYDFKLLRANNLTEDGLMGLSEKLKKIKQCSENDLFNSVIDVISKILPKNVTDLVTLEIIPSESRITTTDGFRFDINSLVHWINEKGEYRNPYNQQIFSGKDQQLINTFAKTKGLEISIGHRLHVEEDPSMLAGALSAIIREDSLASREGSFFRDETSHDRINEVIPAQQSVISRFSFFQPPTNRFLSSQQSRRRQAAFEGYRDLSPSSPPRLLRMN